MPRLSNEDVAEMVALYKADPTATVESVGVAYGVSPETVRKHLAAAGVEERTIAPESDEELGIGEEELPASAPLSVDDILSHPAFAAAVEAAVKARMAMAVLEAPTSSGLPKEFMDRMEQLIHSVEVQKPGYQKPLTPEEIASREAGRQEFFRLLKDVRVAVAEHGRERARRLGLLPLYMTGPSGYFDCTSAVWVQPGVEMWLMKAPPEEFLPLNDVAGAIMRAQMQWLGEPTPPIDELVAQAMIRAKGGADNAFSDLSQTQAEPDLEIVDKAAAPVSLGPSRVMGTVAPEVRAKVIPGSGAALPAGPVFVE
jgi:hypothetical protein